jgi:uncharacterized membrane protein YbhN (UPF0104 family)
MQRPQFLLNRRALLSYALGVGILALIASRLGVEVGAILDYVRRADLRYYVLGLGIYYCTFVVRGLRWQQLLWNVGFHSRDGVHLPSLSHISVIVLLSWFANCIVPARLGDAYRAYLLKSQSGVPFSKTVGTVLAERIIDIVLLAVLLGGSAAWAFRGALPGEIAGIMEAGVVLVVLACAGLLAMRHFGHAVRRLVPGRFHDAYGMLEEGTLGSFQALPLVVACTVAVWAIEAGRLYFVCLALGLQHLPFAIILFVSLASALLSAVPITPAGLGIVESGIVGILLLSAHAGLAPGMDQNLATSVAVLDRSISYWSLILVGILVYALHGRDSLPTAQPVAGANQGDETRHAA